MTSWNGNFYRVTGNLCGEFTGGRWIPITKTSDAGLWCFLCLNKGPSKQSWGWWFETPSRSLWRHCNVLFIQREISWGAPCVVVKIGLVFIGAIIFIGNSKYKKWLRPNMSFDTFLAINIFNNKLLGLGEGEMKRKNLITHFLNNYVACLVLASVCHMGNANPFEVDIVVM